MLILFRYVLLHLTICPNSAPLFYSFIFLLFFFYSSYSPPSPLSLLSKSRTATMLQVGRLAKKPDRVPVRSIRNRPHHRSLEVAWEDTRIPETDCYIL
jgi:hypothetical protein